MKTNFAYSDINRREEKQMKCKDCPYYWADENPMQTPEHYSDIDYLPRCHYSYDDGYAPCEIDDKERETEDTDE